MQFRALEVCLLPANQAIHFVIFTTLGTLRNELQVPRACKYAHLV